MKLDALRDRATLRFIPETARPAPTAPVGAPHASPAWLQRIRNWIRDWNQRRRERALFAALARLDDVTLRDLGIRRSEFGSIGAESLGYADSTRLRIVRSHGEVFGNPRDIAARNYR